MLVDRILEHRKLVGPFDLSDVEEVGLRHAIPGPVVRRVQLESSRVWIEGEVRSTRESPMLSANSLMKPRARAHFMIPKVIIPR